jgi:hypothetical protein
MEQVQCDWCNERLTKEQVDDAKVLWVRTGTVVFQLDGRAHQICVRNYRGEGDGTAQEGSLENGAGSDEESESELATS